MPFAETWIDLEGIMLNKVRERQIIVDITCLWNLKNKLVNITKRQHGYREQTSGYRGGGKIGIRGSTGTNLKYK